MEGFPAPVPCYELVQISGLTGWRARSTKGLSSFVGRAEQISLLERAAHEVNRSGQIVALVGTAGIGKNPPSPPLFRPPPRDDWPGLGAAGRPPAPPPPPPPPHAHPPPPAP